MYVKSKIKIHLNNGNGLLFLMAVFLTTFYLYKDLGISTLLGWGMVLVFAMINFILRMSYKFSVILPVEKISYIFIVVIIGLFFLRMSSRHDADERLYIIAMLIMAFVVVLADPSFSEVTKTCKVFEIMSCFIAIWILFFKAFPGLYWNSVYKVIDISCKELAKYYIPRGYGIPLGGSFTIAYYIMTVGILIMFTNIFTGKKYKKNILSMIQIVLAMIAEGRRGELLAVIVALFFLFLLSKDTTHFFIKIGIIIVLVLIISTSYKVLLEYMKVIPFFSRYVKSIEGIMIGSDITSGRTELWKSAWDIFKENPIFGIGFGGFAYHISGTFRSIHGQDVMDVHNCTLQLLCENGILGTVIILLPMIFLFSKAYHRITITKKRVNINRYYEYAYKLDSIALGIQIFFLVLSQLDPAFYKPVFWGFYGVSIIFMCGSKKFMYLGKQKQMEIKKG